MKRRDAAVANTDHWFVGFVHNSVEVLEWWEAGEAAIMDCFCEFGRLERQAKYRESRFQKGTDSDRGSSVRFSTRTGSR